MKYAIIDKRMPTDCKSSLNSLGFEVLELPPFSALSKSVASHPDMLLFFGHKIFCHKDYYNEAKDVLDKVSSVSGTEIILSSEEINEKYPNDILFNAVKLGDYIFGKADSVSGLIKNYAEQENTTLVNVRQGYTKCSVCKVSENAIITADEGITKAAKKQGIEVLKISEGHITLDGCDYGFIGGASGSDEKNTYFCGNIDLHTDGEAIKEFCKAHGRPAISLGKDRLYDVGTIFFI